MPVLPIVAVIFIAAAAGREYWLFRYLLRKADRLRAEGDRAAAGRTLEGILAASSFFPSRSRAMVHERLAWHYLEEGRPQDAAEQARKAIAARLPAPLESIGRMRLADCLEACGDVAGAAAERERAMRLAESGPEDAAQLMARGKALRKEGRYAESIPVYLRAIALAQGMAPAVRSYLMISLALSCWEAGRTQDALSWADQTLSLNPDLPIRTSTLSVSALALGNLGRLDEAEERWSLALTEANKAGNAALVARFTANLAEVQRRRGRLEEALEASERAAAMSAESRRIACFAAYECLLAWGRFAEAREKLEEAARAPGQAVPASERRIQALTTINRGLLAAEEGRPQEALTYLDQVRDVLATDEKVAINYHTMRAWVEALLGRRAEAEVAARVAGSFLSGRPEDRAALLRYHSYLGRAALELGETEAARQHFEACLRLGPDPVGVPAAHYFLGECCRAAGDPAGAAAWWQAAVDSGLHTRYVQLARDRLNQTNSGSTP